jgi:hypothetical protein
MEDFKSWRECDILWICVEPVSRSEGDEGRLRQNVKRMQYLVLYFAYVRKNLVKYCAGPLLRDQKSPILNALCMQKFAIWLASRNASLE